MTDYLSRSKSRDKKIETVGPGRPASELTHDEMSSGHFVQEEDGLWYGVKGMKWGITTKSKSTGGGSVPKGGDKGGAKAGMTSTPGMTSTAKPASKPDVPKAGDKKPEGAKKDEPTGESSIMRYARVSAAARAGNIKQLSNEDIAFFNARTKALDEVNKRFVQPPSAFKQMRSAVFQAALQRSMQGITDHIMDEFISKPVKTSVTKAAEAQVKKRAAAAALRAGAAAAT